jgi:hypothetical protein
MLALMTLKRYTIFLNCDFLDFVTEQESG